MKTIITQGLEKEAKEAMRNIFTSSLLLRNRLKLICDKRVDAAFSLAKEGYDCPNWAYKQADAVGYQRALREIQSLLD